jgi:CRP/FNR family transcriptional regulator, cyclic AMP receptor protein
VLRALPLFTGCPEVAFEAMVNRLDARDVQTGKVLLMDQEIARTLFILSKGSVGVWKRVGGEKQQLAVLKAPNFFGERSMFEESPASALVKSNERCLIYALERALFDEISAQFPTIVDPIRKNMESIRTQRLTPSSAPKSNPE